jgi:hypothetical protein
MIRAIAMFLIAAAGLSVAVSRAKAAEFKPRCLSAYAMVRSGDAGDIRLEDRYEHGRLVRSALPESERKPAIRG